MKTNTLTRFAGIVLLFIGAASCNKEERIPDQVSAPASEISSSLVTTLTTSVEDLAFCSSKSVSLCAGQNIPMGAVMVQTTVNNLTYITYKIDPAWSLKEVQLYTGDIAGLPINNGGNPQVGLFPFKQTFKAPFTVKEYTFVLSDMPQNFTVAAHASVVKVSNAQSETAWGEGCEGEKINKKGGSWATLFNYSVDPCLAEPEEEICANPVDYYFSTTARAGAWRDVNGEVEGGVVTVGGHTYSEPEIKTIYNLGGTGLTPYCPGAKKGVVLLATLKESYTNYHSYYQLNTNVAKIESWLATKGKISPSNAPDCSAEVKASIDYIQIWIDEHPCPGR